MRGILITAGGWLRQIDITAEQIAETVGTATPKLIDGWFNIGIWCTPAELNPDAEPNVAAMTVLMSFSDYSSDDVPILTGAALLLGASARQQCIGLNDAQMTEIGSAVLASLAA